MYACTNPFYLSYALLTFEAMFNLAKWEYKVMPIKTQVHSDHSQADGKPAMDTVQSELSILGNEGWELVTVQDINLPDGRMFTVAYLKRQSKHV